MKKTIKGKKAAISSEILNFWGYILFVFVIILFSVFFKMEAKATENRITSFQEKEDTHIDFLNCLKTPIQLNPNTKESTLSDLIISAENDKTLRDTLNQEIEKLFDKGLDFPFWYLSIEYPNGDKITFNKRFIGTPNFLEAILIPTVKIPLETIYLPSYSNQFIKITLYSKDVVDTTSGITP